MKIPNIDKAVIPPAKLHGYLLSHNHPIGRFKAEFFEALGYTNDYWEVLEKDIRSLLTNDAKIVEKTKYGQKFEITGTLKGSTTRPVNIITAWIILEGENFPRFITAYPGGK